MAVLILGQLSLCITVNLAPVPNLDNFHNNLLIIHRIHNAVVASPNPKYAVATRQLVARWWPWVGRKRLNQFNNSATHRCAVNSVKLFSG